jgi:hypothetical protein
MGEEALKLNRGPGWLAFCLASLCLAAAPGRAFDWKQDAPRLDYQGCLQKQNSYSVIVIGSSLILTWRGLGLELEHEEGDPFRAIAASFYGGTYLECDLWRLKGTYRRVLKRGWNCRLAAGYGQGTSKVVYDSGIIPLVLAAGLGFVWDGASYSYSERTATWSARVSLEKDFWELFKAELLAGMSHYDYSDALKAIYPARRWSPALGLALGIHTPFGR